MKIKPPTHIYIIKKGSSTHNRQLRNDHAQHSQKVDTEISKIVMRIVSAHQEQCDRHHEQELLGRGVLRAIVDLLPHVEVVVCACVELEGYPPHPVEHDEGEEHVSDVR